MISDSFEVEKQREKETTKGAHARFEPLRLISHLKCDENEKNTVSPYSTYRAEKHKWQRVSSYWVLVTVSQDQRAADQKVGNRERR